MISEDYESYKKKQKLSKGNIHLLHEVFECYDWNIFRVYNYKHLSYARLNPY